MLFLIFALSVLWNFNRLYNMELAKWENQVLSNRPEHCHNPKQLTTLLVAFNYVKSMFAQPVDECEEYFIKVTTDPLWELDPGRVVMETVVRTFISPLISIAELFSKAFLKFFRHIPLTYYPILAISCLVCLIFLFYIVAIRHGYALRIPFFLKFEPNSHHHTLPTVNMHHAHLEKKVDEISEQLSLLKISSSGDADSDRARVQLSCKKEYFSKAAYLPPPETDESDYQDYDFKDSYDKDNDEFLSKMLMPARRHVRIRSNSFPSLLMKKKKKKNRKKGWKKSNFLSKL